MKRCVRLLVLVAAAPFAGCVPPQVPDPLPLALNDSAELEFVKGHAHVGLGHAGGEYYMVCTTPACTERRFSVSLGLLDRDSIVRRVRAGEIVIAANTMNIVGRTTEHCDYKAKFYADAGRTYVVQTLTSPNLSQCAFVVRDKETGLPVAASKVSLGDQ